MINDYAMGRMLTVTEVAKILHIHSNTARRWADSGIIKGYCLGTRGDRRFKQEDINQYLAELPSSLRSKENDTNIQQIKIGNSH